MAPRATVQARERLGTALLYAWAEYLADTTHLSGAEYEAQELVSWRRLRRGLVELKSRGRLLDLEDEHR